MIVHTPESDSDPAGGSGNASAQSASWESSWTWCGFYSRISLPVRIPLSFLFRISAIVPAAACLLLLLWRKFIFLIGLKVSQKNCKIIIWFCYTIACMSYLYKIRYALKRKGGISYQVSIIAPPKKKCETSKAIVCHL